MKTYQIFSFVLLFFFASCATNKDNLSKRTGASLGLDGNDLTISKVTKTSSSLTWNVQSETGQCFACSSDSFAKNVYCQEKDCRSGKNIAANTKKSKQESSIKRNTPKKASNHTSETKVSYEIAQQSTGYTEAQVEARMKELLQAQERKQQTALKEQQIAYEAKLERERHLRQEAENEALLRQNELDALRLAHPEQKHVRTENIEYEKDQIVQHMSSMQYFIQIASLSQFPSSAPFEKAASFGAVYHVFTTSHKVRVGYFDNEAHARLVLEQIRQAGFTDAFLVEDVFDMSTYTLLLGA